MDKILAFLLACLIRLIKLLIKSVVIWVILLIIFPNILTFIQVLGLVLIVDTLFNQT